MVDCIHLAPSDALPLESLFAAIVENSFDAIVAKDLDGTVRTWNRAAERIFGWAAADIVGSSIRTIIPADRAQEEEDILDRVRRGEQVPKFETLRRHRDGRLVPVAITVSPLLDASGRIVGASKIAHDISETVAFRDRLSDSEREFRTLANTIPQLAWMADGNGTIFWYNDRWYEYTGTTLPEVFGWGWTRVQHPNHLDRVRARIQHSWDTGEEWEDTFPLRGRDGTYRWFLSRAKPLRAANGQVWRWFGTNTDITAQREAEQQIQLLMGEVNHRAKNMLAVVQALVSRTVDRKYADNLASRLRALARNQDLLTRRNWSGAPLRELIVSQLAVAGDLIGSRVTLEVGTDLTLAPSAAETIGLAIHELATNATKHGALSDPNGQVRITCGLDDEGPAGRLLIRWEERDGPSVATPESRGFGTIMIDHHPRFSLGAEVTFGYPPGGFFWHLAAPLERVRPAAD